MYFHLLNLAAPIKREAFGALVNALYLDVLLVFIHYAFFSALVALPNKQDKTKYTQYSFSDFKISHQSTALHHCMWELGTS